MEMLEPSRPPIKALRLEWTRIRKKRIGRNCSACSLTLVGDRLYLLGGQYEGRSIFFLNSKSWFMPVDQGRSIPGRHAAALVDDKIYIYGSIRASIVEKQEEMLEYDIVENMLTAIQCPSSPHPRHDMSAVFLPWSREIVYFGGAKGFLGSGVVCDELLSFNVDSKSWREMKLKGITPLARAGHTALLVDTKMYVFGGYDRRGLPTNDLWIAELSPFQSKNWSFVALSGEKPVPRKFASLNLFNGYLVLFGGQNRNTHLSRLWFHSPEKRRWCPESKLGSLWGSAPTDPHTCRSVQVHDGVLYITEGGIFKLEIDESMA